MKPKADRNAAVLEKLVCVTACGPPCKTNTRGGMSSGLFVSPAEGLLFEAFGETNMASNGCLAPEYVKSNVNRKFKTRYWTLDHLVNLGRPNLKDPTEGMKYKSGNKPETIGCCTKPVTLRIPRCVVESILPYLPRDFCESL